MNGRSVVVAGDHFFALGAGAVLLGDDVQAWAEPFVRKDPQIHWILGNYVEADNANLNGHIIPLADLAPTHHTVVPKALNMLHQDQYCVGTVAASELLGPDGEPMDTAAVEAFELEAKTSTTKAKKPKMAYPHVQTLSAMWSRRFPDEFDAIEAAHKEGTLFHSMEARPKTVQCPEPDCQMEAAFDGLESDTYCEHMNGRTLPKICHMPIFGGSAIVLPPAKPGWGRANVKTIEALIASRMDEAGRIYDAFKATRPDAGDSVWEAGMAALLLQSADDYMARQFSSAKRQELAKKGHALPDGSFPIENASDLANAKNALGRAKPADRPKVIAHIKKRAKALGKPLPDGWPN